MCVYAYSHIDVCIDISNDRIEGERLRVHTESMYTTDDEYSYTSVDGWYNR